MGKRSLDRLMDWLGESEWSTPTFSTVTRRMVKMTTTEEMAIIPDTEHGPMLEISLKDSDGELAFRQRLSLGAVDDLIGKLIKMRDHMAQMKGEQGK